MTGQDTPRHYPFVTRMVDSLYRGGLLTNVATVQIEPEYGYATRIRYNDGSSRLTRGNDVGLNSGAACDVMRDKAYTKHFLRLAGVRCPRGEAFLLTWWADRIRPALARHGAAPARVADQLAGYAAAELGFPVYLKPVDGSQGVNVWRCADGAEIAHVLAGYEEQRIRVALVEEAVDLPDFRLVVLDGELISAYRRVPLTVVGDGRSTVAELLAGLRNEFHRTGRDTTLRTDDPRIAARLRRSGLDHGHVPGAGEHLPLLDISNLSTGGTAVDHTDSVAVRWRDLAIGVAHEFGLRFCGVDLACADLTSGHGTYSVLEVNAAPGLDHYGSVGAAQEHVVRDLYARVLNTPPVPVGRPSRDRGLRP
ncbi:hypothetical protein [Longispora urticae]